MCRRTEEEGRAPNAIDISYFVKKNPTRVQIKFEFNLNCRWVLYRARPSTDTAPSFLRLFRETAPILVAFYDTHGDAEDTVST